MIYEPIPESDTFVARVRTQHGVVERRLARQRIAISLVGWRDPGLDFDHAFKKAWELRTPPSTKRGERRRSYYSYSPAAEQVAMDEGRYWVKWGSKEFLERKPTASERTAFYQRKTYLANKGLIDCLTPDDGYTSFVRLAPRGLELVRIMADEVVPGANVHALPMRTMGKKQRR